MDPIDVTFQIPWRDEAAAYASAAPRQRADIARTDEAQNHIAARECRQHGRSGHAARRTLVPRCGQQREAQAPPQRKHSKPTNNSQRRRGSACRTRRAPDRGPTGRRTARRTTKHRRPYSPPPLFLVRDNGRNLNNCKSRASDCERSHSKQMNHRLALMANIEFPLRNLTP